jgi:hypothetical protein
MSNGKVYVDRLVACGDAPGYRDVSLTVEINEAGQKREVTLYLTPQDAVTIMKHVLEANRTAWATATGKPLDAVEGEQRPRWL